MIAFHCDPEIVAESYVMGSMSESERESFATHLKGCAACERRVLQEREFVNAMRAACQLFALESSGDLRKPMATASGSC